ncbi:MAG: GNAT family N-acetyltransferase, partial [Candidatus Rokuibacteriota bacterium]
GLVPGLHSSPGMHSEAGPIQLRLQDELTLRTAYALCALVREQLDAGGEALVLNLDDIKTVDVVGVAALFQCVRRAARRNVALSIVPSVALHRALLDATLLDDVPLAADPAEAAPSPFTTPLVDRRRVVTRPVATAGAIALRRPTWEELPLFERWAAEPLLEQMVGSQLLYRCRHLGAYHPEVVAAILHDATALTLLVEPIDGAAAPVGFVRLFNIHLPEAFAFLETVVASPAAIRRGWGITASRLLLAYAMDVLEIRRVEAKVYAYNVLSINSLTRNGFIEEGVLRRAKTLDGQQWDIVVFSILEEELRAQREGESFPYMGFWR